MAIQELGHAGLWVEDLERMRDFSTSMPGLTITDEDHDKGIIFAYDIYSRDPGGSRGEVCVRIPRDMRQPYRKDLDPGQGADEVVTEGGDAYQGTIGGATKPGKVGR